MPDNPTMSEWIVASARRGGWMDVKQAAAHLGVSVSAVRSYVRNGHLRCYRLATGGAAPLRFRVDDLDALAVPLGGDDQQGEE